MELSPQGDALLGQREGQRNEVYLDTRGIPTVGRGHTGSDVIEGAIWTNEQIADAFAKDAAWVNACLALVTKPLEQNQFDALFSFIFNIGGGQWGSSTMLRMLNEDPRPSDAQIAAQFDRWHSPPEITSRRNAEKAQFLGTNFEARIA